MMASLNKVTLIGNLGADPEIRTLNSGDRVANLRLATSEKWTNKTTGEKNERTEWHRIVIFTDHLVKVAEQYLKKGSTIYVEGQIQTRKWTDQQGVEKYSTEVVLQKYRGEIVMLGSKGGDAGGRDDDHGSGQANRSGGGGGGAAREQFQADLDDEIPFIRIAGEGDV
ncbi:MAG: single-stranded DNA-binding protein [Caulobacterales bacterium]|nr:single-stranded DNA-binding protein [Caulobacterales bacterium]